MITVIDRKTGKKIVEKVYGEAALDFLYGTSFFSKMAMEMTAKNSFFSKLISSYYNSSISRNRILPFIADYGIDESTFANPVSSFRCFNDFFTRKLKPEVHPLAPSDAIMPADGRYLFYSDISTCDGFVVKGKKFNLDKLLKDEKLSQKYKNASMVIARLCPSDYHRFHFPCDCEPSTPRLINGFLYSVNPNALKQNIEIFSENKRCITELKTEKFGTVLYIEIGATCVGTIKQTYKPGMQYKKGAEKGFFSFGGSCIILLFEQNRIRFDSDLIKASSEHIETLCLMGDSLGTSI